MNIIGLAGTQGVGKDTVADILCEHHGFQRLAFADAVREMALAIDPLVIGPDGRSVRLSWVIALAGWNMAKRDIPEVRRLLQAIGTDAVRNILGKDSWVAHMDNKLAELEGVASRIVLTDIRFENEASLVKEWGGIVVRVVRDNVAGVAFSDHESEAGVESIHPYFTLENNGTPGELRDNVAVMCSTFFDDVTATEEVAA